MPSSWNDAARGVSTTVGFTLLVFLTIVGATTVVVVGGAAIDDVRETVSTDHASVSMSQFDSAASRVALGDSPHQRLRLSDAGSGELTVAPDAGRLVVRARSDSGETVLVDEPLGAVVQRTDSRTVAYQGGGVWRHRDDGTAMVSPPEYHYRGQTLTLPLVRVTGSPQTLSTDDPVVVRANGSHKHFPTATAGNPLPAGDVYVEVTSEYHRGWRDYFLARSDGNVVHYPGNETVIVELTVPETVAFDHAVTATATGDDAIRTNGNAVFEGPTQTGVAMPTASREIDRRINTCVADGCANLESELADGTLENGTYYANGDVTVGPSSTFDTSDGDIDVVVDGDLQFTGSGSPGSEDHAITGDGRVTFYVKGDVAVAGNAAVNTDGDAEKLLVLVHSDAGSVTAATGTPQFTGLLYAPGSSLQIKGGGACGATGGGAGKGKGKGKDKGKEEDDDGGSGCNGNIVGSVVVEDAEAVGNGKLTYDASAAIDVSFDATNELTYLHITENRIDVVSG